MTNEQKPMFSKELQQQLIRFFRAEARATVNKDIQNGIREIYRAIRRATPTAKHNPEHYQSLTSIKVQIRPPFILDLDEIKQDIDTNMGDDEP